MLEKVAFTMYPVDEEPADNPRLSKMAAALEMRAVRPNTSATYLRCAAKFLDAVGKPVRRITRKDVEQFLLAQTRAHCAPRTRDVYLASVRWLLRAAGRRQTTVSIPQARTSRALGTILSGSDVQTLLAAITSIKYRAVLTTAYGAGLRIGEVVSVSAFIACCGSPRSAIAPATAAATAPSAAPPTTPGCPQEVREVRASRQDGPPVIAGGSSHFFESTIDHPSGSEWEATAPLGDNIICEVHAGAFVTAERNQPFTLTADTASKQMQLAFIGINSVAPRLKGNAGEGALSVSKNTKDELVMLERTAAGNLNVWTLFRKRKLLVGSKAHWMLGAFWAEMTVGHCY